MWDYLPAGMLNSTWGLMPRDPNCSACRNLLDLQALAAIKKLDLQIAEDWAAGFGVDVDAALDRRFALVERLRRGPVA